MPVRQVWKRKTPLPKSSPTCHNDRPLPQPPSRNTTHSISPPMNHPQRDRIIDQLHTISSLIDSQTSTPSSPPYLMVQPPTNAQVGCHASFCHCCRELVDIVKSRVEYSEWSRNEEAKKESSDESVRLLECPKPPRDKNQRAFVGGSWSDSGEEIDDKIKDETCLVAQAPNEVCSESSYFSDENSSIDDIALDNEYDKLCKMSLKIITKNKRLKATRNSLENKLRELKDKLSTLEKNKGVDLDCAKCHVLKIKNEKLKDESTRLNKFKKSIHCLNEMLSNQKLSDDKLGLGFNSFEASSSGTKKIKFVKAQKKACSDGGPIIMGAPLNDPATPKINMGPPPVTPGSEKSVSF
ncbi:hypothetical protein Tco_0901051 [Tanacetum coccineum]